MNVYSSCTEIIAKVAKRNFLTLEKHFKKMPPSARGLQYVM